MPKTTRPADPPVVVRPPRKRGLLSKASRLGATMIVARVAAATGKKGVLGLVAGAGAKRLIMRYPVGAMIVAGAYLANRLYESRREIDRKRGQKLLTDDRPPALRRAAARRIKERPASS